MVENLNCTISCTLHDYIHMCGLPITTIYSHTQYDILVSCISYKILKKIIKILKGTYLSSLYLAQLPRGSVSLNILTIYTLLGDGSAECFSNRQILGLARST
jgi:hypothetical protein